MVKGKLNNDNKFLSKVFGLNIAYRRNLLGITQEALAEKIGIEQISISRMERGIIAPRFARLQVFADVLGCSVADLFRMPDDTNRTDENATVIAQIIKPLSQEAQVATVNVIAEIVKVMALKK